MGHSNLPPTKVNFEDEGTLSKSPPKGRMHLEMGCAALNKWMYLATGCTQH